MTWRPQDQVQRDRIEKDLDANLLVEAGAGSGKTTALVKRMIALVSRGTPVEQIAAVTFTRKAAAELRERFEEQLEREARDAAEPEGRALLAAARDRMGRAFLGTIHSFAARLLREHPLEAGLDPGFTEVEESEWAAVRSAFWREWVERCRAANDPSLADLRHLHIDPRDLLEGFELRARYPDAEFAAEEQPCPDAENCRAAARKLLDAAEPLLPAARPDDGWDDAQKLLRQLSRLRRSGPDWDSLALFCDALSDKDDVKFVLKRWGVSGRDTPVHELRALLREFQRVHAIPLLRAWRAHRYAPVMRFLDRAASGFAEQRHARGTLGFEDLLLLATKLLREAPEARRRLGERYRYLLVDEFQDTDPLQAELCFLLASPPEEGSSWTSVTPRPGALFVVGDPKQSIYRFRRADIGTYELVKDCIGRTGEVLQLTQNFRSVRPVADLVNRHFTEAFPAEASAEQAAFAPLISELAPSEGDGVRRYPVCPPREEGKQVSNSAISATCASQVATMIARRIADRTHKAKDFLVLTPNRAPLAAYANELALRNIPVAVTGAGLTAGAELEELLIVLRAITDPANPVLVAAALEGLFAGLVPEDLLAARRAGLRFDITVAPPETTSAAGASLDRLHRWWRASQQLAPDALLDLIVEETGLLPFAASGELGENSAGAIAEIVSVARGKADAGSGSLVDVMERIELAVSSSETEASLRPGVQDAVRVMNLHKAKGLEARVVILAAPTQPKKRDPSVHVERRLGGQAVGALSVRAGHTVLAQPFDWDDLAAREERYLDAERDRLLYVAVTRAEQELWVAQLDSPTKSGRTVDKSLWARLAPSLESDVPLEELPVDEPPGRARVERSAAQIGADASGAAERRSKAAHPCWNRHIVTRLAREESAEAEELRLSSRGGLGRSWGAAVHECLEGFARGRRGANLERFVSAVARRHELPEGDAAKLLALVLRHSESAEWNTIAQDGAALVELQIAAMEEGSDGVPRLVEGVIDAVASVDGEWRVMDWKTDSADGELWKERSAQYQTQVDTYARMLHRITGTRASGQVVRLGQEGG